MSEGSVPFNIPVDKTYAVVELRKDDKDLPYASAVPSCWLYGITASVRGGVIIKEGSCYYPKKEDKLSDWIDKRKKPDPSQEDRWTTYKVKVLWLTRSLAQAKAKSKDAVDKSELSSDTDVGIPAKRCRKSTTKFDPSLAGSGRQNAAVSARKSVNWGSSSESSDTDDDDDFADNMQISRTLELLQKPHDLTAEETAEGTAEKSQENEDNLDLSASRPFVNADVQSNNSNQLATSTPAIGDLAPTITPQSSGNRYEKEIIEITPRENGGRASGSSTTRKELFPAASNSFSKETAPLKTKSPFKTKSPSKSPLKSSLQMRAKICGGNCPSMKELLRLRHILDIVNAKLDKITIAVCPDIELATGSSERFKNVPSLPLKDEEDEEKWETFIEDEQNKAILVSLLASHGNSAGGRESTYGILRKLLSNKIAANYNFKGKNKPDVVLKKKSFEKSSYYEIVIAAIKKHNDKLVKTKSGFDVEKAALDVFIMDWLKDAPKRYRKEESKDESV